MNRYRVELILGVLKDDEWADIQVNWRAFCEEPEMYEHGLARDCIEQYLREKRLQK